MLLKINKERAEALFKGKGWDNPIATLAKKTGFTKSLWSQIINGGAPVSSLDVMLSLVRVAGADPKDIREWAGLFEIFKVEKVKRPGYDNLAKNRGEIPYNKTAGVSVQGSREKTYQARSLTRLELPKPIRAIDYYDDAIPKRVQMARRYGR